MSHIVEWRLSLLYFVCLRITVSIRMRTSFICTQVYIPILPDIAKVRRGTLPANERPHKPKLSAKSLLAPLLQRSMCLLAPYLSLSLSVSCRRSISPFSAFCLCLSIYLSICLSVSLFLYLSIYLPISIYPFLSIHLSIPLSINQSICLPISSPHYRCRLTGQQRITKHRQTPRRASLLRAPIFVRPGARRGYASPGSETLPKRGHFLFLFRVGLGR